jgi:hypothetical protein
MVEVEWVDSIGEAHWTDKESADGLLSQFDCLTCGYLVKETAAGIVLALGANTIMHLSPMAIPREAIKKIHRLRR